MKLRLMIALSLLLVLVTGFAAMSADWAPVPGHIMTKWAKQVSPTNALPEYPRMQMVRKDWINLNGLWDLAIARKDDSQPSQFDKKILVPYPVESTLSGVAYQVQPSDRVWYKRTFEIPKSWNGKKVLLNFGAIDWEAVVYVNGKQVGKHTGGYDPFTCDITDALKPSGSQEIVLSVWDPTDSDGGRQPHGKQVLHPGGIMYTGTTGIWRTAWLEPVPKSYIASYHAVPDIDKQQLVIKVNAQGASGKAAVKVQAMDDGKVVSTASGKPGQDIVLAVKNPKLWSPDKPFLYDMKITLSDGKSTDSITGYFGMRKSSIVKDENGINRLGLNNKVLFQYGPLDQGFWPDGVYTAPTDEALRSDIETMKKLGCNMMRKHVKVEPDRLYYWADKLGLVIWQDMPAGGNGSDADKANFESELTRMMDYLQNHPSIVMWIVFNEGWGQYDTPRLVDMVKKRDPSRLVNNASGWSDTGCGDVIDMHNYPGPGMPATEPDRVAVLGEFGGIGRPVKDHDWKEQGSWGYVSFDEEKAATDKYVDLLTHMLPLIGKGLSAAVYTQTSDCEVEVNGMMTYDREVIKFDPTRAAEAAAKLYQPQPGMKVVVPCGEQGARIAWRYTIEKPADDWMAVGFDDSSWKEGNAAFGTIRPGTKWETADIWIRRAFELTSVPARPYLEIFHDEDAEVYINGQLATKLGGWNGSYESIELSPEAAKLLKTGKNTFAIHCHQTSGGQCIDCGISEEAEKK